MNAWFLFSVDNNYDQPPNNLVAWWKERPSLEIVAKALNRKFPCDTDEETLAIVNIWSGKTADLDQGTTYRLGEQVEGVIK